MITLLENQRRFQRGKSIVCLLQKICEKRLISMMGDNSLKCQKMTFSMMTVASF